MTQEELEEDAIVTYKLIRLPNTIEYIDIKCTVKQPLDDVMTNIIDSLTVL